MDFISLRLYNSNINLSMNAINFNLNAINVCFANPLYNYMDITI